MTMETLSAFIFVGNPRNRFAVGLQGKFTASYYIRAQVEFGLTGRTSHVPGVVTG
jgi:hypothetical protein